MPQKIEELKKKIIPEEEPEIVVQIRGYMSGKTIAEKLENEEINGLVAEIITKMLRNESILEGVLKAIPEDWQYSECQFGDNPTKYDFAWAWIWEMIQENK